MNQESIGNKLFYDTYALYETTLRGKNYLSYSKDYLIFTSLMNLYELYYNLIKENKKEIAEEFFSVLQGNCLEIKKEFIKKASEMKLKEIKRKMSYIDCLGYIMAKENNLKFLTGDKEFEHFDNVLFVKSK